MEEFDKAKATALFKSGLGKAEGELIASIVAPTGDRVSASTAFTR